MPVETTYTSLRERLASVLDQVANDHEVVIVRRRGAKNVAHLLRSPRNAQRLMSALDNSRRGKGKKMSLEQLRREVGLDPTR